MEGRTESELISKVDKLADSVSTMVTELRFFRPMVEQHGASIASQENRLTRVEERVSMNVERISFTDANTEKELAELKTHCDKCITDMKTSYEADKVAVRWVIGLAASLMLGAAGWMAYITNHLVNK